MSLLLAFYLLLNSTLNHYISLYNESSNYFNQQALYLSENEEVSSETIIDSGEAEGTLTDETVSGHASVRSESNSNSRMNIVSAITNSHTTGTGIANAVASSSSAVEVAHHSSNAGPATTAPGASVGRHSFRSSR